MKDLLVAYYDMFHITGDNGDLATIFVMATLILTFIVSWVLSGFLIIGVCAVALMTMILIFSYSYAQNLK